MLARKAAIRNVSYSRHVWLSFDLFSEDNLCEGVLMIHKLHCKYIIQRLNRFKAALKIADKTAFAVFFALLIFSLFR